MRWLSTQPARRRSNLLREHCVARRGPLYGLYIREYFFFDDALPQTLADRLESSAFVAIFHKS